MAQGKNNSSFVAVWLVMGCAFALWFALKGNPPDTVGVDESPARAPATEPAPQQPSAPTFAETIPQFPPATRFGLAQYLASFGLQRPAERREAYATAAALLTGFPTGDPAAPQARALLTEVVARQQLPAADHRPVSDSEMLAYVQRLLQEPPRAPAAAPAKPHRNRPTAAPAPQEIAVAEAPRPPTLAEIREAFGDAPAPPPDADPPRAFVAAPPPPPPASYNYVPTNPGGPVYVRPYTRSDGTPVRGYYRSR